MPEVRYICLSDLHLGADNSLLSRLGSHPGEVDASQPSKVLLELANCLRELVQHSSQVRPTLILNGDALELALTQDNVALMVFERFMELMFPAGGEPLIAPVILLNPGNHDHHLWEIARETQYIEFLEGKRSKLPGSALPPPWHVTSIFNRRPVGSVLLNAVISRHPHMASQGVSVGTVYPNFCLTNKNNRWVIFSHGHYIESIYWLMSLLSDFVFPSRHRPTSIGEIETENFAWIDFFWSAMGRSGAAGKSIEQIYDMLLVPHARGKLIRRLARAAGHHWISWAPRLGEWLGLLSVPFISILLNRVAVLEKTQTGTPLSPKAQQGLKKYIEGPLAAQIMDEHKHPIPAQTAFVFGHTHKPFAETMDYKPFPPGMAVYNTGGWVVDTEQTEPAHGGAIVVVDDEFNVASLRMYNEARSPHDYRVTVEAADSSQNPLYTHLAQLVNSDKDPWRSFSQAVADNIEQYHRNFRQHLSKARVA